MKLLAILLFITFTHAAPTGPQPSTGEVITCPLLAKLHANVPSNENNQISYNIPVTSTSVFNQPSFPANLEAPLVLGKLASNRNNFEANFEQGVHLSTVAPDVNGRNEISLKVQESQPVDIAFGKIRYDIPVSSTDVSKNNFQEINGVQFTSRGQFPEPLVSRQPIFSLGTPSIASSQELPLVQNILASPRNNVEANFEQGVYSASSTIAPNLNQPNEISSGIQDSVNIGAGRIRGDFSVLNKNQLISSSVNNIEPNVAGFSYENVRSSTIAPQSYYSISPNAPIVPTFIQGNNEHTDSINYNLQSDNEQLNYKNVDFSTAAPSEFSRDISFLNLAHGIQNVQESDISLESKFGQINPVTVKAITSGGSVDESFGISDHLQYDDEKTEEVIKNFYFFAAPEEQEEVRPRINFLGPAKKNVNVIFIKAPVPPELRRIEVNQPVVKQDKTVVYVLIKKPEVVQDITVKAAPATKPEKPEIYFLKYKNENEAHEAIKNVKEGDSSVHEHFAVSSGELSEKNVNVIAEYGTSRSSASEVAEKDDEIINIGGKQSHNDAPYVSEHVFKSSSDSPVVVSSTSERYLQPKLYY